MIAINHPIKLLITSQYDFLSSMLDRFPTLLEEWIKKQEEDAKKIASEFAGDDDEVYWSTYSSELSRVDPCYDEEQLFNQAMLIMVYSYYESLLCRLAKECEIKETRPSAIAEKHGVKIDGEYLKIATFIQTKVRPLRNQLCHNNNGTLFTKKGEKEDVDNIKILIRNKYIAEEDGRLFVINRDFIQKVLDGEYKLLIRLADICGFNTKWLTHKDGKRIIYNSYDEIKREEKSE